MMLMMFQSYLTGWFRTNSGATCKDAASRVGVIVSKGVLLLCAGASVYILSYAPLYRIGKSTSSHIRRAGPFWSIYAPVDYLYDYTAIRQPLSWWAARWDVEEDFNRAHLWREVFREPLRDASLRQAGQAPRDDE